ncbi:MAG: hypothetical protein A2V85_03050 [Chloroflexi bacterium RBG_16_72_14]|nr:MAG: hypothetical protein A2V85_03050 [Chloroflexi bacterium RBG_16_72_14]
MGRLWGRFRGTVAGVDDDDRMGRISVRVPSVYGDEESPPAFPATPYAGDGHGMLFLPEVGDGVWVEFEGGDPSHPIWTGGWWAQGELPEDADIQSRAIVTSGGLKVVLDDDAKEIRLLSGSRAEITIADDAITLRFGQTKVVIDDGGVSINDTAFRVTT